MRYNIAVRVFYRQCFLIYRTKSGNQRLVVCMSVAETWITMLSVWVLEVVWHISETSTNGTGNVCGACSEIGMSLESCAPFNNACSWR